MASKSKNTVKKKKGETMLLKKKAGESITVKTKLKKTSKKNKSANLISIDGIGAIGSFGSTLNFQVSDNKVLTFGDFNRTVSGKWTTHESINKKEKTEFVGAGLDTITMNVTLDIGLGVTPSKEIKKIEKAIKKGTVEYLIIGGEKVGSNRYRITEMSEAWDTVILKGLLCKATLNLTFEEYVK